MVIIPEAEPYIQSIDVSWCGNKIAELAMLRLDVLHSVISGNKWYKLKYNIEHCLDNDIHCVLTFGGAYSNHLVATAAMARLSGLQSIGIVKGTYAENNLTPTLQSCLDYEMQLVFVTNEEYNRKEDKEWEQLIAEKYNSPFIIPEGGANEIGRLGAGDITAYIPERFTHVVVSTGTGTTLVGIVNSLQTNAFVTGFAPMKGGAYLYEVVKGYIDNDKQDKYLVCDDWHFGGFGKHTPELITFMNEFYTQHTIPLDIVYTAKMIYGLRTQISKNEYPADAKVLCIHTGGLQGNMSIQERLIY